MPTTSARKTEKFIIIKNAPEMCQEKEGENAGPRPRGRGACCIIQTEGRAWRSIATAAAVIGSPLRAQLVSQLMQGCENFHYYFLISGYQPLHQATMSTFGDLCMERQACNRHGERPSSPALQPRQYCRARSQRNHRKVYPYAVNAAINRRAREVFRTACTRRISAPCRVHRAEIIAVGQSRSSIGISSNWPRKDLRE